jgi:hypothetical protein
VLEHHKLCTRIHLPRAQVKLYSARAISFKIRQLSLFVTGPGMAVEVSYARSEGGPGKRTAPGWTQNIIAKPPSAPSTLSFHPIMVHDQIMI